MTREQKIKLLKNIEEGLLKVDSLKPKPVLISIDLNNGDPIKYYSNGTPITDQEFIAQGDGKTKQITLQIGDVQ
jgi:hypothetical protein